MTGPTRPLHVSHSNAASKQHKVGPHQARTGARTVVGCNIPELKLYTPEIDAHLKRPDPLKCAGVETNWVYIKGALDAIVDMPVQMVPCTSTRPLPSHTRAYTAM